ncbi:MAG: RimK family alpha-L-glutamate ligase [Saprospiraceae bacterium]
MNVLVLTDHRKHTVNNSLYTLVQAMCTLPQVNSVRVASRGTLSNDNFFACAKTDHLFAVEADKYFAFDAQGLGFGESRLVITPLSWADGVVLRIPHPVPSNWFEYLEHSFGEVPVVNKPAGIATSTPKSWLLNVAELCAPMKMCNTHAEVLAFAKTCDTVLKPVEGYGGNGVLRILGGVVEVDDKHILLQDWPKQPEALFPYLAMEYLPRVVEGDKRIVVVADRVLGAVLRIPAAGQWLCNVSQGGRAELTTLTASEDRIVATLRPHMKQLGVVMYGIDTLMGNEGYRVLSEVNTMSIGGLLDMPPTDGKTAAEWAAVGLVDYLISKSS